MVTVLYPREKGGRITYHVPEVHKSFTAVEPPIKEGYNNVFEKGNRNFFLNYRKDVLSKFMNADSESDWKNKAFRLIFQIPMYKWGEDYEPYSPHPRIISSERKQRWEDMFSKPNIRLTFKDQEKMKEIDDFYMMCQLQRQYYNDYTGRAHPLDYFERDEYSWAQPPDFNSMYVQFPEMYVKYQHPVVLPLTTKKTWIEPFEPCRRMTGKYDPYPDMKFPR